MFGFNNWFCSDNKLDDQQLKQFLLPSPLPQWPKGERFAKGRISLGELEVAMVKDFEYITTYTPKGTTVGGVTFYKPVSVPDGFFIFGYYAHLSSNEQLLKGGQAYVVVARNNNTQTGDSQSCPPLKCPLCYHLIWTNGKIYVWKPCPPLGYRSLGFVVSDYETNVEVRPNLDQVMCVREDLTENCQIDDHDTLRRTSTFQFFNYKMRTTGKGVIVGTFFCQGFSREKVNVCCLRNLNPKLEAMPNLEQVEALIHHYGPMVYFHYGDLERAEIYVRVKPTSGGTFTDIQMWIVYPLKGPVTCTDIEYVHFTLRISNYDGELWSMYFRKNSGGEWVHSSNLEFIEGNKPIVYASKGGNANFRYARTYIQGWTELLGIGVKGNVDKSEQAIDASKKYQIIAAEYLGSFVAEPDLLQYTHKFVPTEEQSNLNKSATVLHQASLSLN